MVRWLVWLSVAAVLLAGCVCIHSEKSSAAGCAASCTQPPVAAASSSK
jgi:hypothetical protein